MLFHMLREFQLAVHEDAKVFLPFLSAFMNTVFVTALTMNKSNIQTLLITAHLNEES